MDDIERSDDEVQYAITPLGLLTLAIMDHRIGKYGDPPVGPFASLDLELYRAAAELMK